jgi:hypothetical protein
MAISETITLHIIQITTRDSRQSGAGEGGGGASMHCQTSQVSRRTQQLFL